MLTYDDDPLLSPGDRGVHMLPRLVLTVGYAVHHRVRLRTLELMDGQRPSVARLAVPLKSINVELGIVFNINML